MNLAPADIRKEGAAFELPIALGVLAAAKLMEEEPLARYLFGGELSLDGAVKPIKGVLPLAVAARDGGYEGVMVPAANAAEAALVEGIHVLAVHHLREAVEHLTGEKPLAPFTREDGLPCPLARPPGPAGHVRRPGPGGHQDGAGAGRRRVATTSCCAVLRARARRCWPGGCPASSPP